MESLRKDIEVLSQNHERDVDRKDAIIQMLDRDLEEVRTSPHVWCEYFAVRLLSSVISSSVAYMCMMLFR